MNRYRRVFEVPGKIKAQQLQNNMTAFEQRFYEMLRLHKDNINEMFFVVRPITEEPKEVYGRKVFVQFLEEVEYIYAIVKTKFPSEGMMIFYLNSKRIARNHPKNDNIYLNSTKLVSTIE